MAEADVCIHSDEDVPVLIGTPVYVPLDDFMLAGHERVRDQLKKQRKMNGIWAILIIFGIIAGSVCAVLAVSEANLVPLKDARYLIAAAGLMGMALSLTTVFWSKNADTLREMLWLNGQRIEKAQKLLKHYAYFGDEDKQWSGMKNAVAAVDHWCKMSRIPTKIALYEDPMFGQFGLYISFCSFMDPEADEENLLFFRLKFL